MEFENGMYTIVYRYNNDDNVVELPVKVNYPDARIPTYATEGSAGLDLYAVEDVVLHSNTPTLVKTGISIAVPKGYEAQVRPRSGLALKGIMVVNSPGTIDSDYRGEIGVILMLINGANALGFYEIKKGDRIAQLVINKIPKVAIIYTECLTETERGIGGFGSTGN